jgi:hypothetical protein
MLHHHHVSLLAISLTGSTGGMAGLGDDRQPQHSTDKLLVLAAAMRHGVCSSCDLLGGCGRALPPVQLHLHVHSPSRADVPSGGALGVVVGR